MSKNWQHKILGFILTVTVLFPYTLQAFHALENHEHKVCNAKDAKHFHNQELDCSIYHTPVEQNSSGDDFSYSVFTPKKFVDSFLINEQNYHSLYSKLKSSRAPPYFIV